MLILKRGRLVETKGIELPDGKDMRKINLDGYKYLGVLQLDSIIITEMKEKVKRGMHQKSKKVTQVTVE